MRYNHHLMSMQMQIQQRSRLGSGFFDMTPDPEDGKPFTVPQGAIQKPGELRTLVAQRAEVFILNKYIFSAVEKFKLHSWAEGAHLYFTNSAFDGNPAQMRESTDPKFYNIPMTIERNVVRRCFMFENYWFAHAYAEQTRGLWAEFYPSKVTTSTKVIILKADINERP